MTKTIDTKAMALLQAHLAKGHAKVAAESAKWAAKRAEKSAPKRK
jgi:hypothetical protein